LAAEFTIHNAVSRRTAERILPGRDKALPRAAGCGKGHILGEPNYGVITK
jgi:hypothetical protein